MASRFLTPRNVRGLATRGDPFLSLHREMNRLFDDAFQNFGSSQGGQQGGIQQNIPQLDVHESGNEFVVTADLPGVSGSDIDLQIEGDVLTIRGERSNQQERDERGYHVMERSSGSFQRSLRLPFEPDPERVTAECQHGVLTIHVPKEGQQQRSKRIEVRGAQGSQTGQGQQQKPGQTIEGQHRQANDTHDAPMQQAASGQPSAQPGGPNEKGGSQQR